MKIAINGFGRIGRNFLRALLQDAQASTSVHVSVINIGPMQPELAAHLFMYDTLLGKYPGTVQLHNNILVVDGKEIVVCAVLDPAQCPWKKYDVVWVVESSGKCTTRDQAYKHIHAGAQKVLITAPVQDADCMIIPGINMSDYSKTTNEVISLGSCTTNAIIPMLSVIHAACAIESGFMTTVHAYTNSQVLLDSQQKDFRRARAAAENIIPTSTGASLAINRVLPALKNKIGCTSIRVPVAKVSLIDFSFWGAHICSKQDVHNAFAQAAVGKLKGILSISEEPLVSSDYAGSPYSVIIDAQSTQMVGNAGKVLGWYDNEWAYSQRLKDFLLYVA